jgi:hypothetical protein
MRSLRLAVILFLFPSCTDPVETPLSSEVDSDSPTATEDDAKQTGTTIGSQLEIEVPASTSSTASSSSGSTEFGHTILGQGTGGGSAEIENIIQGTLYIGLPENALGLTNGSGGTIANATLSLYSTSVDGRPSGKPIAQVTSDQDGRYQFELSSQLSASQLNYVVVAQLPNSSEIRNSFVYDRTTDVSVSSTVGTLAAQVAMMISGAAISELGPTEVKGLIDRVGQVLENDNASLASIYDAVIEDQNFRAFFNDKFTTDVSGVDLRKLPPQVLGYTIRVNGNITENMAVKTGDSISIDVLVVDPKGLPVQVGFYQMRSCGGVGFIQDFSSSAVMNYTFVEADITNCTSIIIAARNNDGIEYDSSLFGDLQRGLSFQVTDHRVPPTVTHTEIKKNGTVVNTNNFRVGDTLRMNVQAVDPNSLPLEYRFYLMRSCGGIGDLQDWSSSPVLEYTFIEADITNCTSIIVYVRNNDGLEREGVGYGDLQSGNSFTVRDDRLPPEVSSITYMKNGNATTSNEFKVGDTLVLTVNASDPNSLPLEYRYYLMRNCGGVGDLHGTNGGWTTSNTISHTFVEQDITSCTSIIVYVRNNDGLNLEGNTWGDLQRGNSFNVNF